MTLSVATLCYATWYEEFSKFIQDVAHVVPFSDNTTNFSPIIINLYEKIKNTVIVERSSKIDNREISIKFNASCSNSEEFLDKG